MVWWNSVRVFLLKAWAWCKMNWKFLLGASIPLLAWIVFRNRARLEHYFSLLTQIREDHRREIEVIDRSRDMERRGIETAIARRDETIALVEEAAAAANIELTETKRQEVRALVQKYDSDPAGLALELSKATGIQLWPGGEE